MYLKIPYSDRMPSVFSKSVHVTTEITRGISFAFFLSSALTKTELELARVRSELGEGRENLQMAQLSLAEKETELLRSQDRLL